jgi:small subunit ribosomal protein S6
MALYEVVIVTGQNIAPEEVDKISEKLIKITTDNDGSLISQEYWGARKLAYKIKKHTHGHYVLLNIECIVKTMEEIRRIIKIDENIIRSNIFKLEVKPTSPSRLALSTTAKSYKINKSLYQSNQVDEIIEKIVINY